MQGESRALPEVRAEDLREVIGAASSGAPLTFVALGGSITYAGEGWIGGWLREQFPQSKISLINAGMNGTGSDLAVFRLERDVLAHEPDLVTIEFCVNDESLPDDDAIRYLESLVVHLKQQKKAPAIVFLHAATATGVNLQRHRAVARHYGLLEIDLQEAVDRELIATGSAWSTLFSDDVHPTAAGHALYARTLAEKLQPLVHASHPNASRSARVLPLPLSSRPLLLDGKIIPLPTASGWQREPLPPFWWIKFFEGVLGADKPGSVLELPVCGTAMGLFYALDEAYGSFYANVDGGEPVHISTNWRNGFGYVLLGCDLAAGRHRLSVVLPAETTSKTLFRHNGPVKLGHLLVAGDTEGSTVESAKGCYSPDVLGRIKFEAVPAGAWKWTGPWPVKNGGEPDAGARMDTEFLPEPVAIDGVDWKMTGGQDEALVDFTKFAEVELPAVAYAVASIKTSIEKKVLLAMTADYYAKVFLNGALVGRLGRENRLPYSPHLHLVTLRKGNNDILVKVGSGRRGFAFSLSIGSMSR